jgi:hypothetical protein
VWGHGSNGYGPRRTEWTLDTHDLDARLARALDPLREELLDLDVILSSYKALRAPEASRLRWFRASFFTKLLYFAGYRRGVGGVQPLILDSVVASRLDLPGVTKPRRHFYPNWRSEEWRIYIEWAARQTAGGEPENIEIELFNRGSARP